MTHTTFAHSMQMCTMHAVARTVRNGPLGIANRMNFLPLAWTDLRGQRRHLFLLPVPPASRFSHFRRVQIRLLCPYYLFSHKAGKVRTKLQSYCGSKGISEMQTRSSLNRGCNSGSMPPTRWRVGHNSLQGS